MNLILRSLASRSEGRRLEGLILRNEGNSPRGSKDGQGRGACRHPSRPSGLRPSRLRMRLSTRAALSGRAAQDEAFETLRAAPFAPQDEAFDTRGLVTPRGAA